MINEHKYITLSDGTEIYTEILETGNPVWVIALHGVGEHLGRHNYLPELLGHDFNIFQFDLRGHGKSRGRRVYIEDFHQYYKDLLELIYELKKIYKMKRYVIFGHSMGGLITSGFMQQYAPQDFYPERVFINAPPVNVPGVLGELVRLSPKNLTEILSEIPVSLKVSFGVDLKKLSHDPLVCENYLKDELNSTSLHTKLLLELVKASKEVYAKPIRIKCPAFCTVGTDDAVVSYKDIKDYFNFVEKGFRFKEFPGGYHELHNEVDKFRKPYLSFLKSTMLETLYSS